MTTRATLICLGLLAGTGCLPAQQLRRAVAAADVLLIGKVVRVIPAKDHVLYKIDIEEVLRGTVGNSATKSLGVVSTKRVSEHNKPVPAKRMLLCLHDIRAAAQQLGLPEAFGPYFKMSGHPGSAVVLDGDRDPRLTFTRTLVASQQGKSPRAIAEELFAVALKGDPRVRIEAAQTLAERSVLAGYLTQIHLSGLLSRAAGETDDIPYKIALATVCAERKEPALIPTLCISAEHVGDEAFLKALGRFARFIHREDAAQALQPHIARAKGKTKDRLILALGATSTEAALSTLLDMQKTSDHRAAVEAALRIHGSPRATAAVAKKTAKTTTGR
ncbi:MAG: hypothetical protein KDC87_14440 [Planctomycetes bacterium]|nr:hypothetical protein [Planctomycetota bacterium]MCB9868866.1 hypothetical protein [Planctomycetota bacterium]